MTAAAELFGGGEACLALTVTKLGVFGPAATHALPPAFDRAELAVP
jgi:hypothetical protein